MNIPITDNIAYKWMARVLEICIRRTDSLEDPRTYLFWQHKQHVVICT